MNSKKGAIFDMDGLLFDTERVFDKAWLTVSKKNNFLLNNQMLKDLRGTSGKSMESIIHIYCPESDALQLVNEVFETSRSLLAEYVPVKTGARELLEYMKKSSMKLAVASASPLDLIESNLKISGLYKYFDVIVSGQQVAHGKPAPDIFLLAAKQMSVSPNECYVLEDSINGIYAGGAAGCTTIMIPDLISANDAIYKICDAVYLTLLEMLTALKNNQI